MDANYIISVLLESDVILEGVLNHVVHFGLQLEQLLGELNRVFQEGFILHNLFAPFLNIRTHLLDYVFKRRLHSSEDSEHQSQFVEFGVLEHLIAAGVLIHQILSVFLNYLHLDNSQQLIFGFRLQEVVCSLLFLQNMLFSFSKIFRTVQSSHPTSTLRLIFIFTLKQVLSNSDEIPFE